MSHPAPHRARKRFGQNFLHDARVIDDIVAAIDPQPGQHLVEIGPGQGALTEPLLQSGCTLTVIELDRELVTRLKQQFQDAERFTLHSADALSFDFGALGSGDGKLRIVGNLPYNISTPLLFHLLRFADCIEDMHFMLQKEVVKRMSAQPGNKAYGRLSIMLQIRCTVRALFDVSPDCFTPRPKVTSSVVRLQPRPTPPIEIADFSLLDRVVTQAFSQRRKTLRNALRTLCPAEMMGRAHIDPGARAENLSVSDFIRLSNLLATSPEGPVSQLETGET